MNVKDANMDMFAKRVIEKEMNVVLSCSKACCDPDAGSCACTCITVSAKTHATHLRFTHVI